VLTAIANGEAKNPVKFAAAAMAGAGTAKTEPEAA
jgi:hypothetical protein